MSRIDSILLYPDPILGKKALKVTQFDAELAELAQDMILWMHKAKGIGLAGNQVGRLQRIFVISKEVLPNASEDLVCINPQILKKSRDLVIFEEGCLSLPDIHGNVLRPSEIEVSFQDLQGNILEMKLDDIAARVFQHEYDHLEGILFIQKVQASEKKAVLKEVREKFL